MEIGSLSQASASTESQAVLQNKAGKQAEAVTGAILQGVSEAAPKSPEQNGHVLDLAV